MNPRARFYENPQHYKHNKPTIDLILEKIPGETIVGIEIVGYFYTDEELLQRHRLKRSPQTLKDYLSFLSAERTFSSFNELVDVLEDESKGVDISKGLIDGIDHQEYFKTVHKTLQESSLFDVIEQTPDLHQSIYSESNIETEFERMFKIKGDPIIGYLKAKLCN